MKVLIDSSVWIDYFNSGKSADTLDLLIDNNVILTCGIIKAELIPFLELKKQKELINLLNLIPEIEVSNNWQRIIEYQTLLMKNGVNSVGIPDLQILSTVIENKCSLFSLDKHFKLIHQHVDFNSFYI